MPGRLAGHRHAGEAVPSRPGRRPVQASAQIPGPAPERPTCQHLRVVIAHHDHLLLTGQIDPDDRVAHRHQPAQPNQPRVAVAVTPGHPTTVAHERPPPAMGHQARSASGGRSYARPRHAERLPMPRSGRITVRTHVRYPGRMAGGMSRRRVHRPSLHERSHGTPPPTGEAQPPAIKPCWITDRHGRRPARSWSGGAPRLAGRARQPASVHPSRKVERGCSDPTARRTLGQQFAQSGRSRA